MRNLFRVLAFDIVGPLTAIAALAMIGVFLGWPLWWVSVCSMLCLLIVQAVVVNFVLLRRDRVTVGTDDDGAALRSAAIALMTAALVAAVLVGYTRWTVPDRDFDRDAAEVVRLATAVSEATATFSPQDPTSSIDRAAALMAPEQAAAFKANFGRSTEDLARKNISAQAQTISAGVEALGPAAASVAVVLRATQNAPGQQPNRAVLALRVTLAEKDGKWLVFDVSPINANTA
ncbi:membrane protein [soil metagenome]